MTVPVPPLASIGAWLDGARTHLEQAGITSSRLDSELILAHVTGKGRAWILAHTDETIQPKHTKSADMLVARRLAREPLVHLTGKREFYNLDFAITPDVLTPRVETEQMVDWAVKYAPPGSHLIDVGTGSGAIAVAIKVARPDLIVTATDVTEESLVVARGNADKHSADITFIRSDLWASVPGTFATVCTNLPYLTEASRDDLMEEVKHEPAVALFGGPDGLGLYRRFLSELPDHLEPGGLLFTECDPWQQPELASEAARYGLEPVEQGYFIAGFHLRPRM